MHDGIWISKEELLELPAEGAAWEAVLEAASEDPGQPDLSDQNQDNNVLILARAYVCVRLDDAPLCETVRAAVLAVMETENGGRTLALGRELLAYIVAAELVGLSVDDDAVFRAWLADVISEELDGRTLVSTHQDRPNNWGTMAGGSLIAAAIYLEDQDLLDESATVLHGLLGDRDAYAGFKYGALDWQGDPDNPVGINPAGSLKEGHSIDGVLPEEERRWKDVIFTWPPPQENYVYEALQGILAQAVLLDRQGYDVWAWEDQAILRAFEWLHLEADFPAEGDDTWQPHIINHVYGTTFPAPVPSQAGKNMGYTDWTHAL